MPGVHFDHEHTCPRCKFTYECDCKRKWEEFDVPELCEDCEEEERKEAEVAEARAFTREELKENILQAKIVRYQIYRARTDACAMHACPDREEWISEIDRMMRAISDYVDAGEVAEVMELPEEPK